MEEEILGPGIDAHGKHPQMLHIWIFFKATSIIDLCQMSVHIFHTWKNMGMVRAETKKHMFVEEMVGTTA